MINLGITGNIGCGKSSVSKIFQMFGYKIIDTDKEVKTMYRIPEIKIQVEDILQTKIIRPDGQIDYPAIAEKYFTDPHIARAINEVLYPSLFENLKKELEHSKSNTIIEAALLYESGMENMFDYVICVSTPEEIRQKRVEQFRNISKKDFEQREKAQMPQDEKESMADYLIYNGENDLLIPQVERLVKRFEFFNK